MNYFYLFAVILLASAYQAVGSEIEWSSCGPNHTDPVKLTSLSGVIKNNTLYLSASAEVAKDLTAPIKLQVEVWKKFLWYWSLIPCVDNFGSCTYDDICDMSPFNNKPCPPDFTAKNLPCKCPSPKGNYSIKDLEIDLSILPHWMEKGLYKARFTATKENEELMCIYLKLLI